MQHGEFRLTRRAVIAGAGILGSGLVLGVSCTSRSGSASGAINKTALPGDFAPNAWLRIAPDNQITILVDKSEMGQGVMTALPMILAEELDADWSLVAAEFAPNDPAYTNPLLAMQMTGGSTAVPSSWDSLRLAGATARDMLLEAGASRLGIPKFECRTERSKVVHDPSDHALSYGELAESAAELPVPENVQLKSKDDYTLVGQPLSRLDTREKVEGTAVFGLDVKLDGLLTATVVHPPVFGTEVGSIDDATARSMPGVQEIFAISSGVAVVADTYWHASQAAEKLDIEWTALPNQASNDETVREQLARRKDEAGTAVREDGALDDALSAVAKIVTATYATPFQAHSTPEPMNCTAHVTDGACEIWVPTQAQTIAQSVGAEVTGFDDTQIDVHTTFLGGGFGRCIEPDIVREAVEISQKMRVPVKVMWSRAEDLQHDHYHPAAVIEMKAGLSEDGDLRAWSHHLVAPSHMANLMDHHRIARVPASLPTWLRSGLSEIASLFVDEGVFREQATQGASNLPYAVENVRVSYTREELGIPTGNWRSVAHQYNCFADESFVDELAAAAGKNPLDFRLELLKEQPRLANVLNQVAEMAEWGAALPERTGRGVAIHDYKGTRVAHVAEVFVDADGRVKVHKVWCAVDCGIIINPRIVIQQVESAIAFGLTAALKSAVRIEQGRVAQSNFHDYPMLRMDEMPDVEVKIVDSAEAPSGLGETNVPVIAPAVANAVFAATGRRIRKLPIRSEDLAELGDS